MQTRRSRCLRHRFSPDIISHAVWLYYRYGLSFRNVEDLLAERGITVSYETIRQWCEKFGPDYALWRAVDQDGDVIDILVQPRRDGRAVRRFPSSE